MGKDFKFRNMTWGGNGTTGGKYKFAKNASKYFKWGGFATTGISLALDINDFNSDKISTKQFIGNTISNAISTIPLYGTAWSIGWSLGGEFGPSKWYGNDDNKWFK